MKLLLKLYLLLNVINVILFLILVAAIGASEKPSTMEPQYQFSYQRGVEEAKIAITIKTNIENSELWISGEIFTEPVLWQVFNNETIEEIYNSHDESALKLIVKTRNKDDDTNFYLLEALDPYNYPPTKEWKQITLLDEKLLWLRKAKHLNISDDQEYVGWISPVNIVFREYRYPTTSPVPNIVIWNYDISKNIEIQKIGEIKNW